MGKNISSHIQAVKIIYILLSEFAFAKENSLCEWLWAFVVKNTIHIHWSEIRPTLHYSSTPTLQHLVISPAADYLCTTKAGSLTILIICC
jgi:hypothetical protein